MHVDGFRFDLGARLTGSADLYGDDDRPTYTSVNFVTCHDRFTAGRRHARRVPGPDPKRNIRNGASA